MSFVPDSLTHVYLRQYRTAGALSLRSLARQSGCTISYLQRAEVGTGDLSVHKLRRVAAVLEVSPLVLVEYEGWPAAVCRCRCPCHDHAAADEASSP